MSAFCPVTRIVSSQMQTAFGELRNAKSYFLSKRPIGVSRISPLVTSTMMNMPKKVISTGFSNFPSAMVLQSPFVRSMR